MTIFLENQQVFAHIGWEESERNKGVDLWVDIHVSLPWTTSGDVLANTVDYGTLLSIAINEADKESRLLETYAENMLAAILEITPQNVVQIGIKIRKKNLPLASFQADAAGIRLEWNNPFRV